MSPECSKRLDPRIRRTRELLEQALAKLLEEKSFESISVQDITDLATVNRATFYDHYTDKYALLVSMVAAQFHGILAERDANFINPGRSDCNGVMSAIVRSVCDYLIRLRGPDGKREVQPHMESAVISVVQHVLVEGMRASSGPLARQSEILCTSVAWAIFGAVKEWLSTPESAGTDEIVQTVTGLVLPMLWAAGGKSGHAVERPEPHAAGSEEEGRSACVEAKPDPAWLEGETI